MNTNKFPLASVIIPFYNHNHFIQQTLDSILEDTYPNKEIIMINDGSTDEDDSNIMNWIHTHSSKITINYVKRENRGLTKTMNELLDLASGEYILVCASDDYLINDTIEDRIKVLNNNPSKLIVLADCIVVDECSNLISNSNLFELRKQKLSPYLTDFGLKKMIIKKWGLVGASWLAKRELFNQIGKWDESLTIEDWDFMLKAVSKNLALFYHEKPVSAYRVHSNNSITNPSKKRRFLEDAYVTSKKHIKSFGSPYFKFLLWKNSRRLLRDLKRLNTTNITKV